MILVTLSYFSLANVDRMAAAFFKEGPVLPTDFNLLSSSLDSLQMKQIGLGFGVS